MKLFRNLSIQNKLTGIILLVTTVAVAGGFAANIVQMSRNFRKGLQQDTALQAKLVGEYCVVPLSFHDKRQAENVLAKLQTLPHIESGRVYDDNGDLFASFERGGGEIAPRLTDTRKRAVFEQGYLHTYEPIVFNGQEYGTVYLQVSTSALNQEIRTNALTAVFIGLILIAVSYMLAKLFQGLISKPILELVEATEKISLEGDYSFRVRKHSDDEIGLLYDGFNEMLEQIGARDERVRLLLNSTAEAIYGLDLEGNCTFCNSTCVKILGYNHEDELLGKNMHALIHHSHADGSPYPDNESRIYLAFREGKSAHVNDEVLWRSDGTSFASEYWSYPMHHREEIVGLVVTFLDITERKAAERLISDSLAEKEVLLKEIHHRVKNNLQIVSSLLNLQSAQIEDEEVQSLFTESRNRVSAMALIHEKLYRSENLAQVDFADYIQSLVDTLSESFGAPALPVKINVVAEDVSLDIDTAIPCALIVNELVSNGLKHAFCHDNPNINGPPEIRVEIARGRGNGLTLTVSDNGSGFPEQIDFMNTETLGLQIVQTLTEQLDATLELDNQGGAAFTLRFEVSKRKVGV